MYTIIFSSIIIAGIGVIIFIIAKKFPQLTHLDSENLPQEKEARKKREIISKRLEQETVRLGKKWLERLRPLRQMWGQLQLQFRIYVGKIERLWRHEQRLAFRTRPLPETPPATEDQTEKLQTLLQQASQHVAAGNYEPAEELFIAAIKLDTAAARAYEGLGDTYAARGALAEARETYAFVLRLEPKNDEVMVKMAELAEQEGKTEEATAWYQQALVINDALAPRFYRLAELLLTVREPATAKEAVLQAVELEPKNPKYLDLLIESAILEGDQEIALRGYEELRSVNPDNHKLTSFKERINRI